MRSAVSSSASLSLSSPTLKYDKIYSGARLDAVHSDLSPNLSPSRREALILTPATLVGKGLGVRFSDVPHAYEKRYIFIQWKRHILSLPPVKPIEFLLKYLPKNILLNSIATYARFLSYKSVDVSIPSSYLLSLDIPTTR